MFINTASGSGSTSIYNSGSVYLSGSAYTNLYQYSTSDTAIYTNLNGFCKAIFNNNSTTYTNTTSQATNPIQNFNTTYVTNVI